MNKPFEVTFRNREMVNDTWADNRGLPVELDVIYELGDPDAFLIKSTEVFEGELKVIGIHGGHRGGQVIKFNLYDVDRNLVYVVNAKEFFYMMIGPGFEHNAIHAEFTFTRIGSSPSLRLSDRYRKAALKAEKGLKDEV